ncbi:hypothetical protein GCM10020254_84830 [Streptomyces goshikiensis]
MWREASGEHYVQLSAGVADRMVAPQLSRDLDLALAMTARRHVAKGPTSPADQTPGPPHS